MIKQNILQLINETQDEILIFVEKNSNGILELEEKNAQLVLNLLKNEIEKNNSINERILRAFWDISVYSMRNYSDVILGDKIKGLTKQLYEGIPSFKNLKPLGMDFGKGIPI